MQILTLGGISRYLEIAGMGRDSMSDSLLKCPGICTSEVYDGGSQRDFNPDRSLQITTKRGQSALAEIRAAADQIIARSKDSPQLVIAQEGTLKGNKDNLYVSQRGQPKRIWSAQPRRSEDFNPRSPDSWRGLSSDRLKPARPKTASDAVLLGHVRASMWRALNRRKPSLKGTESIPIVTLAVVSPRSQRSLNSSSALRTEEPRPRARQSKFSPARLVRPKTATDATRLKIGNPEARTEAKSPQRRRNVFVKGRNSNEQGVHTSELDQVIALKESVRSLKSDIEKAMSRCKAMEQKMVKQSDKTDFFSFCSGMIVDTQVRIFLSSQQILTSVSDRGMGTNVVTQKYCQKNKLEVESFKQKETAAYR
ncbi:hypothetical protein GUITHDRAFT_140933 [Guillardia theta CCMP2712]|uniref:Uncharacterized protein n=1 Tax=Guillardia theta (strain CCMP2712) TaxID=905079 RepID=L1J3U5_GUITC|nr:hypothetical protein GUITHDRAFT_140933 [Guillardia theta CCMP2712]EKX42774.1 hypothetical protein GUITHDRAFT_140933 [Guillardia theta CCMP2712]|eukprot:XP_005829754.1 hypothetical protein GUITHDRAFT_140933 [Guillardia theta CCMP2712]